MAINENRSSIKYQQFPKVGKTIATLEGCEENLRDLAWKLTLNNSKFFGLCDFYLPLLNPRYRAIVKVNEEDGDTWDATVGRAEAHAKVTRKYHKEMDYYLRLLLEDARNLVAGIEHYLEKRNIDYAKVDTIEAIKDKRFNQNQRK